MYSVFLAKICFHTFKNDTITGRYNFWRVPLGEETISLSAVAVNTVFIIKSRGKGFACEQEMAGEQWICSYSYIVHMSQMLHS